MSKSKLQLAALLLADIVLELRKTDDVMLETLLEKLELTEDELEEALDDVNL